MRHRKEAIAPWLKAVQPHRKDGPVAFTIGEYWPTTLVESLYGGTETPTALLDSVSPLGANSVHVSIV